jgi:hypothetical protein
MHSGSVDYDSTDLGYWPITARHCQQTLQSDERLDFDFDTADLGIVHHCVETNIEDSVRNSNSVFLHVSSIRLVAAENKDIKDARLDRSVFERNLKQTFTRGIVRAAATNETRKMLDQVKPHPVTPQPQQSLLVHSL